MPSKLTELEELKRQAAEIAAASDRVTEDIRRGFCDRSIVFLDVVGSTAFKEEHREEPHVWILRVSQFSELLAAAVESAGGQVVKYIGDEVMASFENPNDAANLVHRVPEIEARLEEATGFETRIKVAADYGKVYELTFDGHDPKDPQGMPVDRCARIAKYGEPGEVLASHDFVKQTGRLAWKKVGKAHMKGLGLQAVYQLGKKTVELTEMESRPKEEWEELEARAEEAEVEAAEAKAKNTRLVEQLEAVDATPEADAVVRDEEGEEFPEFHEFLDALKQQLKQVPVSVKELLFREYRGESPRIGEFEEYDFVDEDREGWVCVDDDLGEVSTRERHPRMGAIADAINDLSKWLEASPEGFEEWHYKVFECEATMSLRPFWEEHLSL